MNLKDFKQKNNIANHTAISNKITWQIINKDGSIAKESNQKNLILNAGLDLIAINPLSGVFKSACVGTGNSTPASNQIGLDAEIARTNTYLTSTGACGSTVSGNIITHKRTFDFPLASINSTVYEMGFSPSNTPGENLFSRTLFKDNNGSPIGIDVTSEQQLRIVYSLIITYGSNTWQDGTVNITGIGDVPYKHRAWYLTNSFIYVGVDGNIAYSFGENNGVYFVSIIEPFNTYDGLYQRVRTSPHIDGIAPLIDSSEPLNGYPTMTDTNVQIVSSAYTLGTFYRDRVANFTLSNGNTGIQWLYIESAGPNGQPCDVFYFPTPIAKDNLHTLSLTLRQSWGPA